MEKRKFAIIAKENGNKVIMEFTDTGKSIVIPKNQMKDLYIMLGEGIKVFEQRGEI